MLIGYARVSTNEQNLADFSVVLFRPDFTLVSEEPPMKTIKINAFEPTLPS
jgi:hypothetical protein